MNYYKVTLINPDEPKGYHMVALVEEESAVKALLKAQREHSGLFAIDAEILE